MSDISANTARYAPEHPMTGEKMGELLRYIYQTLLSHYGPQHWWPAEEPFEVMVGAILTQSCAWRNVEKAIAALRDARAMSAESLRRISVTELATLIRPCGYYNAKALKLKSLVEWLGKYCGDGLNRLASCDTACLRNELLSIHGVGEETADSILLYALDRPVFVVDAYTRRIVSRIGLADEKGSYAGYQTFFMGNLPQSAALYNEYHALMVRLAKEVCRKKPLCQECRLSNICRCGKEKKD